MIILLYASPGRMLVAAFVSGCAGAELLAHGFHTNTERQIIGGIIFTILALVLMSFGILLAWRFIRGLLS